jgi:hypothetical protein
MLAHNDSLRKKPQTTVKNSENLIMMVLSRPFIFRNIFALKNGVENNGCRKRA